MSEMHWFRIHHGMPNDPKWRVIAAKAQTSVSEVIAVWITLMDHASQADDRGSVERFDVEGAAVNLGIDEEAVQRIVDQMDGRVLESQRIRAWERRQVKRERPDDKSTERTRAFRERKRQETPGKEAERQRTPENAREHPEERRGEKRRDSKSPDGDSSSPSAADAFAAFKAMAKEAGLPVPKTLTDGRRKQIQAILKKHGPGDWQEMIDRIPKTPFLLGESDRGWKADLDWVLKPANFVKICEGSYDRTDKPTSPSGGRSVADVAADFAARYGSLDGAVDLSYPGDGVGAGAESGGDGAGAGGPRLVGQADRDSAADLPGAGDGQGSGGRSVPAVDGGPGADAPVGVEPGLHRDGPGGPVPACAGGRVPAGGGEGADTHERPRTPADIAAGGGRQWF